jgi:McrBC 5-methylcytosine restriction system component
MGEPLRIRLKELGGRAVRVARLTDAAGLDVHEVASKLHGFVDVSPSWEFGKVSLSAGQSIGAVEIGLLRVEVRPRLAAIEAAALVRYALGGEVAPKLRATFPTGPSPGLDELLCQVLADEADRIRQLGLSRLYTQQRERLTVLRGRPDFLASFPWDDRRQDSLVCSYHLLTCDNLDNRLLRESLERSSLLDVTPRTRARLLAHRRTWCYAASAIHPAREDFAEARRRYTRLTEHYRLAHNVGEIILARERPTELFELGAVTVSGLILSMPFLFEKFVERLVREEFVPHGVTVKSQHPDKGAILDDAGEVYRRVRPDLVGCRGDEPIFVVDAKYKQYWPADRSSPKPKKRIANADLYQLFFYAQRLQLKHGLPRPPAACIVSPLPAADERAGCPEIGTRYKRVIWRAGHEHAGDVRLFDLPLTDLLRSMIDGGERCESLLADLRSEFWATTCPGA